VRIVLSGRLSSEDLADGGTTTREVSAPKSTLTLEQRGRVLVVTQVVQPGPAARAGLRSGDVISAIDGEVPLSAAHARMLRTPAGRTALVRVLRNKHPVNLQYRRPAL
jgi:S1-C subfamily serine protease